MPMRTRNIDVVTGVGGVEASVLEHGCGTGSVEASVLENMDVAPKLGHLVDGCGEGAAWEYRE
jgi:hypothetical protein